ncbi:zinc finger protein 684-like [Polypterus senegalus]|uniref:zinc finger protein 684-like n=1 Tax=Polypterus senegalus TaxID=55291 RepID=UPI001963E702|nr:zinc finger protein 684-like [Polypterus senegalus]
MEKANSAVQGPQHVKYKCEEGVSEEVCEDEQETYLRMHWGLLLMHGIEVDEEHCKWSSGHLEQESVCINKQEDCDCGPMDFTVDSELLSYITNVHKNKTVSSIKEEVLSSESDMQCSYLDEEGPGLGLTPSRHCPLQQQSVNVKLESDIKRAVKASDPSPSAEASQASGSSFLSPLAQTSPQCRSQQTVDDKNMKNLTLASETGIPAFLLIDSQSVMKLNTVHVITTQTQIPNTDLTTVYQKQSEWVKSKRESRDGNLCQTQQEPFESSECGKLFSQMCPLKTYRIIHAGEKPFSCPKCGKGFTTIGNLHKHVKIHSGEKPYCCSECRKQFRTMSNLQEHRRIHTGEKPFSCPECGNGFTTIGSMHKHITIHTGEKPYCCSECRKQFRTMGNLQEHRRIHTGEKPYCCSECRKRFRSMSNLYRHRRIHTGEKPYYCPKCGMGFTSIANLQKHQNK